MKMVAMACRQGTLGRGIIIVASSIDQQSRLARRAWRRLLTAGALMIAVMAVGAGARADRFVDGNRLYELCRPNSRSSSFCGDFVMGVANALMVGRVGHWTACIPNGVTDDQVIDVATRYLDAHPAERPHAAGELVAQALAEAFPCRQ